MTQSPFTGESSGGLLSAEELAQRVERLCAIERGSATAGESEAAELIAAELGSLGAAVRLERERAHGTYWWPIGVPTASAAIIGATRRRLLAFAVGTLAAVIVADDLRAGRRWFRRKLLRGRETVNVVAEMGERDADRTIVVAAHHDAAHAGLVFHPNLPRSIFKRFPALLDRANTTPPSLWGAVAGPLLVALGAVTARRRLRVAGTVLSAGHAAAMLDIGVRGVVAGANDNASGVAVLLSLAHSLSQEQLGGIRVVLLSTGSEESFMEGMDAFLRRNALELPRDTRFVVVDTVGSPHLVLLEGEGFLGIRDYPESLLDELQTCANELGIFLWRGLRFRNGTDGYIAMKAGYPAAMLGSVDRFKVPTDYHWRTDQPSRLNYETVADAARLLQRLLGRAART